MQKLKTWFQRNPDSILLVLDGDCILCSGVATFIAKRDKDAAFHFIPLQSDLGAEIAAHYGVDATNPQTWLYINEKEHKTDMQAVVQVGRHFGGVWRVGAGALALLPRKAQQWIYKAVAKRRYVWFGRQESCLIQKNSLQGRLFKTLDDLS